MAVLLQNATVISNCDDFITKSDVYYKLRQHNDKCWCECKKRHVCEKDYVWNPAKWNCENGKYLASIMDDSAIICDKVIDSDAEGDAEAKSKDEAKSYNKTNFNEKKTATCKTQNFYVSLAFLLITIALLIAVSIYCYLIKYWAKQLLPFHDTNNKLRKILY